MTSLMRSYLDRWARWRERERCDHMTLYYPRRNWIDRMGEAGQRAGPIRAAEEPASDDIPEIVERFMVRLRDSDPTVALCLEARHRRVIHERSVSAFNNGRPATEKQIAQIVMGAGDSGNMRFRRACERGYKLLEDHLTALD